MILPLILIQIVTFAVIIAVLHFLFGAQVKIALNRLQVLHQESLEKEEVLNKEIERAKLQAESEIARAKDEAKTIVENAHRNAEKTIQETTESVHVEAKKIIAEAGEKAKKMESEIIASAEEKAVSLAQKLIQYTFTSKGQELLHRQLLDELIEDLNAVDKEQLNVKADRAEVTTTFALTAQERQRLKEVLASKLGRELKLEEKIDEALITGIVIKLGGLVIDGSLNNKLTKVLAALRLKK